MIDGMPKISYKTLFGPQVYNPTLRFESGSKRSFFRDKVLNSVNAISLTTHPHFLYISCSLQQSLYIPSVK